MTTTASQIRTLTPWFVKGSTKVLAIVLAIASLAALGTWALATAQGWAVPVESESDGEVFFTFSTTLFGIPLAAVGIAAFVLSIVQTATYTRALVASGATRASVAAATLANGAWIVLLVNLLAATVLALEVRFAGGWIWSTFGMGEGETFADGVPVLARAAGQVTLAVVAGMLIAALFLRWPWWVGVGVLALVLWVIPILAPFVLADAVAEAISAVAAWPGLEAAGALLLAGAYWLVMRGLRVP